MKVIFFLLLFFISPATLALKVLVITDEKSGEKSQRIVDEAKAKLKSQDLPIEFIFAKAPALPCKWDPANPVLPLCEQVVALQVAQKLNADTAVLIWDQPKQGKVTGSRAGTVAMLTTNSSSGAFIHELLHTLGLGDEYAYSNKDADLFCTKGMNFFNLAVFKDVPPYTSDQDARKRHASQIPWYGLIKTNTFITTGNQLGSSQNNVIGLFRANTCKNAWPPVRVWKPGNEVTIMEDVNGKIPQSYIQMIPLLLGMKKQGVQFGNFIEDKGGVR